MRYAICNETFEGWDHARVCKFVAGLGYQGLEIAPFTLAGRITDVSAERRPRVAAAGRGQRPQIIGLHWLLAKTTGLLLTSRGRVGAAGHGGLSGRAGPRLRRPGRRHPGLRLAGAAAHPGGATQEQATEWAVDTFRRPPPASATPA